MSSISHEQAETEQDRADLKALIYQTSVFLNIEAGSGCGLTADNLLRYIAAKDRLDNKKTTLAWESKTLSARCGLPDTRKPVGELLSQYLTAGLLTEVTAPEPGKGWTVTFPKATKQTIRIPLPALFTHSFVKGSPDRTRYGKDTGTMARFYVAQIATCEFGDGLVLVNEKSVKDISEETGMPYQTYRRAEEKARELADQHPWVTFERMQREDLGMDGYRVTIDWTKLPFYQTDESDVTPTRFEQGGGARFEQGGPTRFGQGEGRVLNKHKEETNPLSPVLNSIPLPQSDATITISDTEQTPKSKAGAEKEKKNDKNQDAAYTIWVNALIAGITATSNPNALPMTQQHAQALTEPLTAAHNAGWDPSTLAACLTLRGPDVTTVVGALRHRLRELGAVNVIPISKTSAQAKTEAAEQAAFERAASSRSAAKYTQRTL